MGDRRRLRRLRVRVGREHRLGVPGRADEQHAPERERAFDDRQDRLPLRHPVHRHVDVVAGARRVQAARRMLPGALRDQPIEKEEQVLAVQAVEARPADGVEIDRVERGAYRARVAARHDPLLRQQQELCLCVLEILVQHEADVVGRESHLLAGGFAPSAFARGIDGARSGETRSRFPRLSRLARRRYAPSTPAGS